MATFDDAIARGKQLAQEHFGCGATPWTHDQAYDYARLGTVAGGLGYGPALAEEFAEAYVGQSAELAVADRDDANDGANDTEEAARELWADCFAHAARSMRLTLTGDEPKAAEPSAAAQWCADFADAAVGLHRKRGAL